MKKSFKLLTPHNMLHRIHMVMILGRSLKSSCAVVKSLLFLSLPPFHGFFFQNFIHLHRTISSIRLRSGGDEHITIGVVIGLYKYFRKVLIHTLDVITSLPAVVFGPIGTKREYFILLNLNSAITHFT